IETLRNDFIVNVSHEFKTPLAAIEGYATLMQDPHLSIQKKEQYTERIIFNCAQLSSLSSNILALSKLETQEFIFHKKIIRLDEQLRKNILLLENKWEKKHIQFHLDLPQINIFGDEQLLDRVWYNLIDNAIKYSHDQGIIEITIDNFDSEISVSISDEGIGIQQENLKYIFDKFYQVDHSRQSDGNGLGLSLVKEIIELCHGSIHVVSFPNIGSTFTVILPKK
ncbi:MAG: sensor histidine kinase, partial [Faecalibacillus sp.]